MAKHSAPAALVLLLAVASAAHVALASRPLVQDVLMDAAQAAAKTHFRSPKGLFIQVCTAVRGTLTWPIRSS